MKTKEESFGRTTYKIGLWFGRGGFGVGALEKRDKIGINRRRVKNNHSAWLCSLTHSF
jgi:hypothetical protein